MLGKCNQKVGPCPYPELRRCPCYYEHRLKEQQFEYQFMIIIATLAAFSVGWLGHG